MFAPRRAWTERRKPRRSALARECHAEPSDGVTDLFERDCHACEQNVLADLPPRETVVVTPRWRVAHAFDSSLPGWLVLLPRRHVTALDQLDDEELAEMGLLQGRVSAALREVVGCVRTYAMLYAEAEGFAHLHVHLVPRMADQPADRRGPAVFGYLGADAAHVVPTEEQDRIGRELAALVSLA